MKKNDLLPVPKNGKFLNSFCNIDRKVLYYSDSLQNMDISFLMNELNMFNDCKKSKIKQGVFAVSIGSKLTEKEINEYTNKTWQTKGEQAYFLLIGKDAIHILANDYKGIFYGVMTLKQIFHHNNGKLLQGYVEDWPVVRYRGFLLDISRGAVPTLETLKNIADVLSGFKMNAFCLYIEDVFTFKHHPQIGKDAARLNPGEIKILDRFCIQRGIELFPLLQSFGHYNKILELPKYRHLANSSSLWSLDPTNSETYEYLDEIYSDCLPCFSSKLFYMGADEIGDIGEGKSEELAKKIGKAGIFCRHVKKTFEYAKKYGKENIFIPHDMMEFYPGIPDNLPKDLGIIWWKYNVFDNILKFNLKRCAEMAGKTKNRIWISTSTNIHNSTSPLIKDSRETTTLFLEQTIPLGVEGILICAWEPRVNPLGTNWYSCIWAGEQSWSGPHRRYGSFNRRISLNLFNDRSGNIVKGLCSISAGCELERFGPVSNAGTSVYRHMLRTDTSMSIEVATIPERMMNFVKSHAQKGLDFLKESAGEKDYFDEETRLTVREIEFNGRLTRYAAEKSLFFKEMHVRGWGDLLMKNPGNYAMISKKIKKWQSILQELRKEHDWLEKEGIDLWDIRNKPTGKEVFLGYFHRQKGVYDRLEKVFNDIVENPEKAYSHMIFI